MHVHGYVARFKTVFLITKLDGIKTHTISTVALNSHALKMLPIFLNVKCVSEVRKLTNIANLPLEIKKE